MDRKEAIEIVRKNYPHVGFSGSEFETALRELVPEFKEQPDPRHSLIEFIKWSCDRGSITPEQRKNVDFWLAYLERQKKQTTKTDACGFPIRDKGESACSYLERCLAPDMRHIWYEACAEIKERQKDKRELDFAEGKVDGAKQTCQEIKDAMSLFEPKDLTPFEFTFRDYIDSAIRYCVSGEGYQQYIKEWAADLLNLERQKEHKLPEPEYGGENKQYPTEYRLDQDTRKKLIALVEKFGQEEDKEEMLDYLEKYQPVQSASEVKEFNFQPGDPDEKAIKRLKEMIYFAFDETSEVPMDEACALDDWLDDKCKTAEWSEEDDAAHTRILGAIAKAFMGVLPTKPSEEDVHWLKTLPERFYLQPKQEWTEEDEKMYARVVRRYTDYEGVIMRTKEESVANKMLDAMAQEEIWFKSLRPQPYWKPSKDEITAIEVALKFLLAHTSDEQLRENAISVLEHLKQL